MNQFTIDIDQDVLTLSLQGQITYEICPDMKKELEAELAARKITMMKVDMSATSFLDSHGIGILVMLHKLSGEPGRDLRIVSPSKEATIILDLVGLLSIFTVEG